MPISHYPREGYPLAPATLRELLTARIPPKLCPEAVRKGIQFGDLDETAWREFPENWCRGFGRRIVQMIADAISSIPIAVRYRLLPPVPPSLTFEEMELEQRTYNCLCKMKMEGLITGPSDLARRTVQELVSRDAFGAKSLVDLLTSLEYVSSPEWVANRKLAEKDRCGTDFGLASAAFLPIVWHRLRLPSLPETITLGDLGLSKRTHDWLRKRGFSDRVYDLTRFTLGEFSALPGFRLERLVELLEAINELWRRLNANVVPPEWNCAPQPRQIHPYLEDEFRELVVQGYPKRAGTQIDRNVEITMKHFGLDGGGRPTLAQVGNQFGLTRERVRQICDRSRKHLAKEKELPPLLSKVTSVISSNLPRDAKTLEELVQHQGLSRLPFRLEGLLFAFRLFGKAPPFAIEEFNGRRMALRPSGVPLARRVVVRAQKSVSRFGVATVADVAASVQERSKLAVTPDFAAQVLEPLEGFEWLDKENGWFWFRLVAKNRVVTRIRKILAVADTIQVAELRSGIARHHQMNGYAPPRRILFELCARLPFCFIDGIHVRARGEISWVHVLKGTEYKLVEILKEHGSVMQRAALEDRCVATGMKRPTFYAYLAYSPVIERFASGVYGIRGAKLAPGLVESLIPKNQRTTTVRLDHGWTPDRKIWVAYRLSAAMVNSGAFGIPAALKKFLHGEYKVTTADGVGVGTVPIKGSSAWGLGPFFRRRGGEPGDTLLIVFDLTTRGAVVRIGADELLDQFHPGTTPTSGSSPK